MDLDLRKVRYFVAVAEELHFGRAAERLHIAQPVLSRQIRALEDELKTRLFSRDRRATALTPAGEQLLADARPLLAAAEATRRRLARAARGTETFTIGFMPGLIVTGAVRELSRRHPRLGVEVVRTGWDDQIEVIHDGRVDVGYVRLPVDRRGLEVRDLFTEPRVAVLPAGHPLADRDALRVSDLAGERLLQDPAAVPEWPVSGVEPPPSIRTVEEKLEHVAAGHGVVVLPLSTATFYSRPGIARAEVSGLGPSAVCLAWDAARPSRLIEEFAAIAAEHGTV
ncbi:LysR substrate-binding domain-containing protein [Actinomadura sp. DC4]|uniref:LysR family transcriptional regulator n=1 Tax=Actinomadura sp. DC4 TaxID=3055069 RepID=UPI0025AEF792|nr:LysR substrate-binding domain-containing protein [Actinomadura sp. DC4]MDN3353225.1 LysR substrate-binding domain-containing protein [Actinomadura sp. DC4]